MGIRIDIGKTEVQLISKRKTVMNITIRGNKLKQVREFFYLGGKFDEEVAQNQMCREEMAQLVTR